jgi:triacylglycerol lipase
MKEGMVLTAMGGVVLPQVDKFYPYRINQFGVTNENLRTNPLGTFDNFNRFRTGTDFSEYDLGVDGAAKINQTIQCQKGIYYFSYAGKATRLDSKGNEKPSAAMTAPLIPSGISIGLNRETFVTPGGTAIDSKWFANDGLVNTISALYPFDEPHQDYNEHTIQKGIWNVMPILQGWDHATFCGLGIKENVLEKFFLDLLAAIPAK